MSPVVAYAGQEAALAIERDAAGGELARLLGAAALGEATDAHVDQARQRVANNQADIKGRLRCPVDLAEAESVLLDCGVAAVLRPG